MYATYARDTAIGRQLRVLAFREHAVFKLYLAIIEQKLEAVTRKQLLLLAIACVVLFRSSLFDTLDLCGQLLCFACHGGMGSFLFVE